MSTKFYNEDKTSRQAATNAFLSAFTDRTIAFEMDHLLSLYTFNTYIEKKCDFNDNFE